MEDKQKSVIFIGGKEYGIYYKAIMRKFESGNKEVTLSTRGRYTTDAVKIAEFITRTSEGNREIKDIKIGSSPFEKEINGKMKKIFVPTIDILILQIN